MVDGGRYQLQLRTNRSLTCNNSKASLHWCGIVWLSLQITMTWSYVRILLNNCQARDAILTYSIQFTYKLYLLLIVCLALCREKNVFFQ